MLDISISKAKINGRPLGRPPPMTKKFYTQSNKGSFQHPEPSYYTNPILIKTDSPNTPRLRCS